MTCLGVDMRHWLKGIFTVFMFMALPLVNATELQDFDGHSKNLTDYTGQGKWLVVMIWAHDCHVCNAEAHQYVKFHNQHQNKDAQVLGISADGKGLIMEAKGFINKHKLSFPNLLGEPDSVAQLYYDLTGVPNFGTPSFLIYNPAGELRAQQIGAVPVELIETFMAKETAANPS